MYYVYVLLFLLTFSIDSLADLDDFTHHLYDIYKTVKSEGIIQASLWILFIWIN